MLKRNVAILIFDDVEVLDFAGPFEVFSVTSELNDYEPFHVYTVAPTADPITARNGLKVIPDFAYKNSPKPDILIIPGGAGTRKLMTVPELINWVNANAQEDELTLSVCTGALVLAKAGLLQGLSAVTHHENLDELKMVSPSTEVVADERFLDNGEIITAGGISAGIDMSLHVVARLLGEEVARRTAVYMEYGDWRDL